MRYVFMRYPEGKFKAVTFSYDDGVRADVRFAGILDKYKMKGTFNINSGFFGRKNKLTPEEIKTSILDAGHEVAVHGENHVAPGIGSSVSVIGDVLDCRRTLESEFGIIIRGMAYPDTGIRVMHNGNDKNEIKAYLRSLGIVYSRTLGGDNDTFMLPTDFLEWMPSAHHNNPKLMEYVDKFVSLKEENTRSANRFPRLFYLWGHSYEFDDRDNWNVIEDFCEAISGKDDTWYATNMEIYEYVKAYESLVTSADGKRIYNPSLKDVWIDVDGKSQYKIASGETVVIEE